VATQAVRRFSFPPVLQFFSLVRSELAHPNFSGPGFSHHLHRVSGVYPLQFSFLTGRATADIEPLLPFLVSTVDHLDLGERHFLSELSPFTFSVPPSRTMTIALDPAL